MNCDISMAWKFDLQAAPVSILAYKLKLLLYTSGTSPVLTGGDS